ncbi:MAG: DUF1223 domain-containing protein [Brevundimonas sp.]|uniref:DUF1223 domain-containing protein n=1 Tax=Brevundimonas sp. TaxID=1871086 RepID=UPI0025BBC500|nr:DUF1223 domain-containing protein [Brevundimonas sp.]MBX3476751.1 DUF1223 domain-containing protein [Brevundimonas sp.]
MKVRGWITGAAALVVGAFAAGGAAQPTRARPAVAPPPSEPVVIELFTAQGCAGCPDANRAVEAVAAEPGVIALTYAVDYWDYLGWSDTFARPEFAARQQTYRQALKLRALPTPQVIVDGARQSQARPEPLQAAITAEIGRRAAPPEIEFRQSGDAVGVGSGRPPAGGAEVWAVVFVPGPQEVEVARGDNRGQTVRHVNVVRRLTRLGDWTGRPALFRLPAEREEGEAVAVLVQAKADRRILTAAVG